MSMGEMNIHKQEDKYVVYRTVIFIFSTGCQDFDPHAANSATFLSYGAIKAC